MDDQDDQRSGPAVDGPPSDVFLLCADPCPLVLDADRLWLKDLVRPTPWEGEEPRLGKRGGFWEDVEEEVVMAAAAEEVLS